MLGLQPLIVEVSPITRSQDNAGNTVLSYQSVELFRFGGVLPYRNKIRVAVHPQHQDVWYWLIPFSNGRCSLGVVAEPSFLDKYSGDEMTKLKTLVGEDPNLRKLLANAVWDTPARTIKGYSADVKTLAGPGFALLGNAGEFLDPVFSSGVTIALTSASLAAKRSPRSTSACS